MMHRAIGPRDNGEVRTTRRDYDTRDAAGHMIRRSARAAPSWVVLLALSVPCVSTNARHVCHSLASLCPSARRPPGGSRIDRTDASVRLCLRPGDLRQHASVVLDVVWIGAGPGRDKRDAQIPSSGCAHDQCRHVGARGSEVSRSGLLQDQFVQRQARYRPAQALVLLLELLQFLELFCAHSSVLFLPTVIGLLSHIDLSDRINPGHALPHQNFNLPQLHGNLFGLRSSQVLRFPNHRGGPRHCGRLNLSCPPKFGH